MDPMTDMPAGPLRDASYYVEELKYMISDDKLQIATDDAIGAQIERLLGDAGHPALVEPADLLRGIEWLGQSLARSFRCHPGLATSVMLDGVLHGMALMARLSAPPREEA
jgi:hypothetical protein